MRTYATVLDGAAQEMIVELDGCEDRTGDVVKPLEAEFPAIKVVQFPKRLGKGGGILEGVKRATGEWVAFVDADGALSPTEFLGLFSAAQENGHDGVVGFRYLDRRRIQANYGFFRWLMSRGFNLLVRTFLRFPFRDTQSGAKIFRREAVKAIESQVRLTGYAFDVELLWRFWKQGFDIREVPIRWDHKDGSTLRVWREAPKMFVDVIRLRLNP